MLASSASFRRSGHLSNPQQGSSSSGALSESRSWRYDSSDVLSSIEDAKEGRGVDVGIEIVTEKKRIKAVGEIRWFKVEEPNQVAVGILLKGMGREDRQIWEDLVKSIALSL